MSSALQTAHHLKVRVGDSEFEATGEEDVVNAQYSLFLEAIAATRSMGRTPKNGQPSIERTPANQEHLDGPWGRFYTLESDGNVSLKVLPNTEQQNADAIVLLLYGYAHLREADTVGGTELLAMARKSGLRIDRIDRNVPAAYNRYINRGGSRRGSRYSLNNQGLQYAQQILDAEFER